mmetsp:Transcript_8184/g.9352  ORF Transcript_8184/g.9352 Transcript_8184/m.9352 type:complete len:416 (-) Transcript_8184:431-1678(-)|eukprot:CAMPEP_0184020196 /NCGR_PEP_ID=MMETSP0954-20121128/9208_1 /TAXON_ID=627963 /ORGANISM="Aplanochytrium sp, Strain PBS07" /LENGTH=415 /DNA_ID=CAMNT_0026302017 /DNA_START=2094 /DNA_END=3341 /DNA_ORIENTATION=-
MLVSKLAQLLFLVLLQGGLVYVYQGILLSGLESVNDNCIVLRPVEKPEVHSYTNSTDLVSQFLKVYVDKELDPLDDELFLQGFPLKPLTIETARLCDTNLNVMYESTWKCKDDPTCSSCFLSYQRTFYDLREAFRGEKETLRMKRLETVSAHFGQPKKWPLLSQFIPVALTNPSPIIMVMAVNFKQLYLLLNWACAVERLGIDPTTICYIITTDTKAYEILRRKGFIVENPEWTQNMRKGKLKGHSQINHAVLLAGNELIQAGYDIVFHDVDIVWVKDIKNLLKDSGSRRDLVAMVAPYWNTKGIMNSGFVYVRNTRKSRLFLQSLENLAPLKGYSDQELWNIAFRNVKMIELEMRILPQEIAYKYSGHRAKPPGPKMQIYHAVGPRKPEKLKQHNVWFFNEEACPRFFENVPIE